MTPSALPLKTAFIMKSVKLFAISAVIAGGMACSARFHVRIDHDRPVMGERLSDAVVHVGRILEADAADADRLGVFAVSARCCYMRYRDLKR